MSPILIGVLGLLVLLIFLFAGMHIGIAMTLVGFFGVMLMKMKVGLAPAASFKQAVGVMTNGPFASCSKESMVVIPMFTLMGVVCAHAGISQDLYSACYKWVSRVRGGLAIATEVACAFFGAICGSATATTASMGKICLPEMDKYGYKRTLSCGAISAGGTLGLLIPPSTGFMLYGINAGVGVGKMFISGIIPGIILCLCYAATAVIICLRDPEAGPKGPSFPMKEKVKALLGVLPVLVLFILVLGGILFGWCSATEGGAVGAFGAFIFMIIRKKFTFKNVVAALRETLDTTAMIFLIMIGSDILGQFFAATGISSALATFATTANVNRWLILLLCLLIYGILGCFVDSLPLICLLTPIFLPVVTQLGFDAMWFGVLMVMLMEFGLMTPPVGMCCYVMAGITKGTTSLGEIFKGTAPFLIGIIVAIVIVMAFPAVATWLPSFMSYG
jgi:tripartite ATP-independent transporter DctM subunit